MRVRSHIARKERKVLTLSDFRGVDFSSSPYRVAKNRATSMKNLINEYGVNHKRPGWREVKSFRDEDTEKSAAINGIFEYVHSGHHAIIIHAGANIYRVTDLHELEPDITAHECISEGLTLTDTRSQAFFSRGRLYIIGCGDYLVYGTWDGGESYELRRVYGDSDTYVPTTSVSIDNDAYEADAVRATLDVINRLTPWRKNKLVGAPLTDGDNTYSERTWTLDSGYIDKDTAVTLTVDTYKDGEPVTYSITNSGEDKSVLYLDGVACGSVNFDTAKITLTIDTTPQVEQMDNIEVTFSVSSEGIDTLCACSFGILFGADGYTDRLFLSGNTKYPNIDFYSEAEDYTYFPERNYCTVGSDASAITGYIRLADSTLAIFKEEYPSEPSLFYRTGTTQIDYGADGVISDIYGIFPSVSGSIGESLISRYATANFGDDSIMLSRNGVFGIVLGSNSRTTERYTRERSRSINEKLKNNDLGNAVGIVYENKYYLSVDECCYVADARFLFRGSDSLDGAYNYEWWYWDNIPARTFAVLEDRLFFGTNDGKLCVFDNEFTDRTYYACAVGDLAYNTDIGTIAYRSGIKLDENDMIEFDTDIYAAFVENCRVESSRIYFDSSMLDEVYNGAELYAENVYGTALLRETKYYISDADREALTFRLADSDGNLIELADSDGTESFSLCRNLKGKRLYVTAAPDSAEQEFSVKEFKDGITLRLIAGEYNAVPQPTATVTYSKNVVAEWYSPILDMGTNESSKTLLKLTICTEPEMNGNVTFGYETRRASKLLTSKGLNNNIFSFNEFSFENFTFETGYASSYSVNVKERNFNFVIFRFISDSNTDFAVNDFTVIYKVNKSNKGVR